MPMMRASDACSPFLPRVGQTMLRASELKWDESRVNFTATFKPSGKGYGNLSLALFVMVMMSDIGKFN